MLPKLKSSIGIATCVILGFLIAILIFIGIQTIATSNETLINVPIIEIYNFTNDESYFNLLNKTQIPDLNVVYACPKEDEDFDIDDGRISKICECSRVTAMYQSFDCNGRVNNIKVNRTDFIILRENFAIEYSASFSYNLIESLKKDKILPGNEAFIESLDFNKNKIHSIENGTFDKFVSLVTLILAENYLTTIHEGIFTEKLGQTLDYLDLSENPLINISLTPFKNLKNLRILMFEYNKIPTSNFFEGLSNLTVLHCYDCIFSNIHDENLFKNLKNLETLFLGGSSITSIPKSLNVLSNLKMLDIKFPKISSIDNCAFCELKKLKKFYLNYNYNLLYIHENAFGSISNNGSFPSLEHFNIYDSNIETLSEKLLNWKKLDFIMLGDNHFNCNCSLAWLIKDFKATLSSNKYSKHHMKCFNPPELRNREFLNITKNLLCATPTTPNNLFTSNYLIITIVIVAIIIIAIAFAAVGIYFYRNCVQAIPYQRHNSGLGDDEEDKLPEDVDASNNA